MGRPTKMQEREQFIAEFLRRVREAPPGTRVYMPVGDMFKDADVVHVDDWRAGGHVSIIVAGPACAIQRLISHKNIATYPTANLTRSTIIATDILIANIANLPVGC
jgi:hypothetical protein